MASEGASVVIEGYLKKKGDKGLVKSFKRRWFRLENGAIGYWKDRGYAPIVRTYDWCAQVHVTCGLLFLDVFVSCANFFVFPQGSPPSYLRPYRALGSS